MHNMDGGIVLPRCKKSRCCRFLEDEVIYKPAGIPCQELNECLIELDEFEAMRLCDLEGLEQTEAGEKMGVSRGTIQRLLNSGRRKLIAAILTSSAICIKNELRRDDS